MSEIEFNEWLAEVTKWWDDNEIEEFVEDPPGEVMFDAFDFIHTLIKQRKDDVQ